MKPLPYFFTALFILYLPILSNAETVSLDNKDYVRTDRYTLVSIDTKPEQVSPLLSIIDIEFGRNIVTVNQAIKEILRGSGYRWDIQAEHNTQFSGFELPAVTRQVGPIRLQDALITIAGAAWELRVDDFTRRIWFEPKN